MSPGLGSPSAHGAESPTADGCWHGVSRIGEYLLVGNVIPGHTCRALHTLSGDELVCKVPSLCVHVCLTIRSDARLYLSHKIPIEFHAGCGFHERDINWEPPGVGR